MSAGFDLDRETLRLQHEQLRRDVELSRLRTGVLLLVATFFLFSAIQAMFEWLLRFHMPAVTYSVFFAVAPNVIAWLLWATSFYLSLVRRWRPHYADDVTDHRFWYDQLQSATYQLERQRRLEAYVAILAAIQIIAVAILLVSPLLFSQRGW